MFIYIKEKDVSDSNPVFNNIRECVELRLLLPLISRQLMFYKIVFIVAWVAN